MEIIRFDVTNFHELWSEVKNLPSKISNYWSNSYSDESMGEIVIKGDLGELPPITFVIRDLIPLALPTSEKLPSLYSIYFYEFY